eukprot:scaffold25318_cov117-Isochrysis_galbana.AAC.6
MCTHTDHTVSAYLACCRVGQIETAARAPCVPRRVFVALQSHAPTSRRRLYRLYDYATLGLDAAPKPTPTPPRMRHEAEPPRPQRRCPGKEGGSASSSAGSDEEGAGQGWGWLER